jgi:hypothetical protein
LSALTHSKSLDFTTKIERLERVRALKHTSNLQELKKRELDDLGKKKELQARLAEFLEAEAVKKAASGPSRWKVVKAYTRCPELLSHRTYLKDL